MLGDCQVNQPERLNVIACVIRRRRKLKGACYINVIISTLDNPETDRFLAVI